MIISNQHTILHRKSLEEFAPKRLIVFAIVVFALCMALPNTLYSAANQSPLDLTGPADMELLAQHMKYTLDPAWQLKVDQFVAPDPEMLKPLPGSVPDFGYTPAKIWLLLPLVNRQAQEDSWRFFVHANFTQQIAIYKISADNRVTTLLDLTMDSPFSARPVNDPQMVAPFELKPGEAASLVIAYYSQGASRLSMSIETPDSFALQANLNQAKNYAFYGMMLIMILLASVALVVLRQSVFAAYTAYLVSVALYIAHADGVAFQYIWSNFPRFNSMASIAAGTGIMVFGILFCMTFLETRRFHPIMHRVLAAGAIGILLIDAILWTTDPQLLKRIFVVLISISTLACALTGVIAARKRFREVRFYVFAWLGLLIPATLFTARFSFGIEIQSVSPYDVVRVGLVFDAMMVGLALFDRYNYLRLSAVEDSLAQAQRNLLLSQRLTVLEGQYEQVTASARQHAESVRDTVHDLRQPMHALRLSLQQMIDPQATNGSDAGQIESALSYMERLVADRLADRDQSQPVGLANPVLLQTDGMNFASNQPAEPGLHDVLRGVTDMFAAEAAAKGLDFRLVLAAPDAEVAAYPLMRILANLVSNAIKYTPNGRILIGLRRRGTGYAIDIHDTGPGLSGAAFEQALQRNQRLDRDLASAEGSGLGLAVAKEIAEAQGWQISSRPGRLTGASIRVVL